MGKHSVEALIWIWEFEQIRHIKFQVCHAKLQSVVPGYINLACLQINAYSLAGCNGLGQFRSHGPRTATTVKKTHPGAKMRKNKTSTSLCTEPQIVYDAALVTERVFTFSFTTPLICLIHQSFSLVLSLGLLRYQ